MHETSAGGPVADGEGGSAFWRPLLHRWFIEYNPFYLLSATLVLAGMIVWSHGVAEQGSLYGSFGIAAVAEVYAAALIGGAALLMRIGQRRPAVMLALDALIVAVGPGGERVIPVADFFVGGFETALGPAEILTEIRIPLPPPRSGGAYVKLERKVGDYATAAAASQVVLGPAGAFDKAALALTNAGPTPLRCVKAQEFLVGKRPTEAHLAAAARLAAEVAAPSADRRGSVEYNRDMARVLTARALRIAVRRAEGK